MIDHESAQEAIINNQLIRIRELQDQVEELEGIIREMGTRLNEIACLGNGDRWGNSIGNVMAQNILSNPEVKKIMEPWSVPNEWR